LREVWELIDETIQSLNPGQKSVRQEEMEMNGTKKKEEREGKEKRHFLRFLGFSDLWENDALFKFFDDSLSGFQQRK